MGRRGRVAVVAMLVLSGVVGAVANPAQAVVGGDVVSQAPPWVAVILANNAIMEEGVCTGTVIAPRFILTAAHCVSTGTPKTGILPGPFKWRPSSPTAGGDVVATTVVQPDKRVVAVNTANANNHDDLGVKAIHVHPNYRTLVRYKTDSKGTMTAVKCDWLDRNKSCREVIRVGVEWDFAIIELNNDVPAPAAPITLGALDDVAGDLIAYGYGVYQEGSNGKGQRSDGLLRSSKPGGITRQPNCDFGDWPGVGAVTRASSGWFCLDNGVSYTAPGDSGGPNIKWVGSQAVQVGVTSWGGSANSWAGDVGAARPWIADIAGLAGGGDDILVVGNGEGDAVSNLVAALEAAGHTVTASPGVPEDLAPYAAIFDIEIFATYDTAALGRLSAFVRSGGGLFMTGERPCCVAANQKAAAIVSDLVLDTGVIVETVDAAPWNAVFPVNADVVYGIDDTPNIVTGVSMASPGGISGVEAENVIVTADAYAAGAAWGDAEIDGGQGRLAVFMDVNWLNNAYTADVVARDALVENLARFLTVR